MTLEVKDAVALTGLLVGLPLSLYAVYKLVLFWKSGLRKERAELADLERETAYLL